VKAARFNPKAPNAGVKLRSTRWRFFVGGQFIDRSDHCMGGGSRNETVKVFPDIIGAKAPNAGVKLRSYNHRLMRFM